MPKQFVAGKTYKTAVPNFFPYGGVTSTGITFTCDSVDEEGDCWTKNLNKRIPQDNCVVLLSELEDGLVVEV